MKRSTGFFVFFLLPCFVWAQGGQQAVAGSGSGRMTAAGSASGREAAEGSHSRVETSVAVSQVRLSKWTLQSSEIVTKGGEAFSSADYQPANYWFPVTVPTTVLSGLVANKVYPDPYIGMNNMLIPDASDSFNRQYHLGQYSHIPGQPNPWKKPYWYRTVFDVPASDKGRHFQLIFKGINYRAEVWLNGRRLADSSKMVGMFEEFDLDASSAIHAGETNGLAVKIYPLDEPGLPAPPQLEAMDEFYDNGGPTGDIGKNVTMLSSVGWDWIPEVRDRNMGIWQPVFLRTTGQVVIEKPQIITELPALPDTSVARLSLNLQLTNNSGAPRKGVLVVSIAPENFTGDSVQFSKSITLAASGKSAVHLSAADVPQLLMHNPHLWWPNGYGDANLYRIRVQFKEGDGASSPAAGAGVGGRARADRRNSSAGTSTTGSGSGSSADHSAPGSGSVSDEVSFAFGIRTVGSSTAMVDGWVRRDFFVNGKKIHLVGGAWVPDMMLNRDRLRYDYELRLCRNANVNMVRIWGGGLGETDDFYELADMYGLLVWQDFWITGDTNGGFKGSADWPLQSNVFIDNVVSTIYRIRNHPSLLVWTGGNEGHAREELYNAMRDNVATLDGTRPFIPCSSGFSKAPKDWKGSWPDNKPAGVYSGGPYSWQDEAQYYRLVDAGHDWVFKDETGIPSQPPYNTLTKIIPDLIPDPKLPYPLNNSWGYHDACTGNGKYDAYYQAMVSRYGAPASMRDFSGKMQLMNASGYRGIFEAAGHKLRETGGVMLWKLNAAFPSVIWQVYDWYLEPNAGYYFMQRACEPLHIQLNLDDSSVALVNRTYLPRTGLHYEAEIVGMTGHSICRKEGDANLDTVEAKPVLSLRSQLASATGISFVLLKLKDAHGAVVSRNVYWMSPGHDFADLRAMPKAQVKVEAVGSVVSSISAEQVAFSTYTIRITNTSSQLAFFLNPQVIKDEEEVLPSYWSDNYFSIPAGESVTVTVSCPLATVGSRPSLRLEGWNIEPQVIKLPQPFLN